MAFKQLAILALTTQTATAQQYIEYAQGCDRLVGYVCKPGNSCGWVQGGREDEKICVKDHQCGTSIDNQTIVCDKE